MTNNNFEDFEKYIEVLPDLKKDTNTASNYRREIDIINDSFLDKVGTSLESMNVDDLTNMCDTFDFHTIIDDLKSKSTNGTTSYTSSNFQNALKHYINFRKFIAGVNNVWLAGSSYKDTLGDWHQFAPDFIKNGEYKLSPSANSSIIKKFSQIKIGDIIILKSATNTKHAPFPIASNTKVGVMLIYAIGKVESVDLNNNELKVNWLKKFDPQARWYGKGVIQPTLYKIDLNGPASSIYKELLIYLLSQGEKPFYHECPKIYAPQIESSKDGEDEEIDEAIDSIDFNAGAYNKIFYGVPGCGKSYYIKNVILPEILKPNNEIVENLEDSEYVFRTIFYQDYSHTDFVGQYMPKTINGNLIYSFVPKVFTLALQKAYENPDKNIVMIIEELNRGEAASIFGDLFQLLDRDENGQSEYKINCEEIIDYLKDTDKNKYWTTEVADTIKKIFIPSNLYILATMNTCDQNVFALDTAFKRRWDMEEIPNNFGTDEKSKEFKDMYIPYVLKDSDGKEKIITWEGFVKVINNKIKEHIEDGFFGDDRQIGCYFVNKSYLCTEDDLKNKNYEKQSKKFANKIIEYLWNDVAKTNKSNWFNPDLKTLHDVISNFENKDFDKRCKVFSDDIYKELLKNAKDYTSSASQVKDQETSEKESESDQNE